MTRLHRSAFAFLLLPVLLPACLKVPPAGVSVKSATANLVFGVPPIVEDVPPPNFEEPPPPAIPTPRPSPRAPSPAPSPRNPCPDAGPFAHPEEVADPSVIDKPKEGGYYWKLRGRDKDPTHEERAFGPFNYKVIDDVTEGSQNFDFTTGEYEFGVDSRTGGLTADFVLQTFRVVQSGPGDKGIFLVKVVRNPGSDAHEFRPEPPVLLAELPMKVPMEIRSAGVDPDTLAALSVTGSLTGRTEVDACGQKVQVWLFKTQQQFTSATGANFTRTYHYGIATQYGGWIAYEYIEAPPRAEGETEPHLLIEQNTGTLQPGEIAAEFRKYFK